MTESTINLEPFCADRRQVLLLNLSTPWAEGGYRYATNGCVIVRVPCSEPDTDRTKRRLPKNVVTSLKRPSGAAWEPWPTIIPCTVCTGDGMAPKRCVSCKGDGRCHDEPCESCCGQGAYMDVCPDCFGMVTIGPATVRLWFARIIAALPNVEMIRPETSDQAIQFRFDGGGEGAVMPLDPEKDGWNTD